MYKYSTLEVLDGTSGFAGLVAALHGFALVVLLFTLT